MAQKKSSETLKNKSPTKMRVISIALLAIMTFLSVGSLAPWRKIGLLMIFGYWFVDSVGKGWLSKRDSETLKFIYFSIFSIPMLYFLVFKIAGRNVFSADLVLMIFVALVAYFFNLSLKVDYGVSVIFGPLKNPSESAMSAYKRTRLKSLIGAAEVVALATISLLLGDVFFNRNISAHFLAILLMTLALLALVSSRLKFIKHTATKGGRK